MNVLNNWVLIVCYLYIGSSLGHFFQSNDAVCQELVGPHVCQDLPTCQSILSRYYQGLYIPTHCGFSGVHLRICCPLNTGSASFPNAQPVHLPSVIPVTRSPNVFQSHQNSQPSHTRQQSHQTNQQSHQTSHLNHHRPVRPNANLDPRVNFECGQRYFRPSFNPRPQPGQHFITGGRRSAANTWPWMALLAKNEGPTTIFFCGGSLINGKYVVTAAHCVEKEFSFFVRLGEHDQRQPSGIVKDVLVDQVLTHPQFRQNQRYNDVALLKLAQTVNFKNELSPVCLPWSEYQHMNLVGQEVAVAGWGSLGFGRQNSPVLHEANLTVFDASVCYNSYATLSNFQQLFPRGMGRDDVICAGSAKGGTDSCQGDSGGPVMKMDRSTGKYSLVGIISTGHGCGDQKFPGINSPVGNFDTLNWIRQKAFL